MTRRRERHPSSMSVIDVDCSAIRASMVVSGAPDMKNPSRRSPVNWNNSNPSHRESLQCAMTP